MRVNPPDKPSLSGDHVDNRPIRISLARVENMAPDGKIEAPHPSDKQGMFLSSILRLAKSPGIGLIPSAEEQAAGQTTKILFMPLSALPANGILESLSGTRGGKSANDFAVCWTVRGEDLTPGGDNGFLSGVMMVDPSSANFLYAQFKEDPRSFLPTIDHLNGGLVRRWDGQPAQLDLGKNIKFMPNIHLGGKMSQASFSKNFK